MSKGLDIFRWLFPSSTSGTDTTQALTDDMPLASMISACVDVEASFADPMALSRPQICPEPPDVALLPLPSPSDSGFDQLIHFLHDHVSDHLRRLQQAGTFTEVFATFIVGPTDHSNAGSSLHSHLYVPPQTLTLTTSPCVSLLEQTNRTPVHLNGPQCWYTLRLASCGRT